jgi:adenylate cyclase
MDTSSLSRWIIEHATGSDNWYSLLDETCRALLTMGIPLWRVSLGTMTLDPSTRAFSLHWHTGQGVSAWRPDPHGPVREAAFQRSPIQALAQRDEYIGRWRLDALQPDDDLPLLHELHAQGGIDYVLHRFGFSPGSALVGGMISFATQRASGFTEADLAAIEALRPALGLAMAKLNLSQTLRDVLSIYVGRTTGARVLEGQIRRGQGRTVSAAILFMDLRGFTTLTDRNDPLAVVGWLDEHFDALGKPVTERGGEILKFVGDGFLAIFPVHEAMAQPCSICDKALDAATDALRANIALNARRSTENLPELAADLVLHFGEVVYGNVGSDRRLDFTVIGRAVNEASRIEGHCEALGHALLISDAFAARCARPLVAVGTVSLRGLANPQRVWSVASPLG